MKKTLIQTINGFNVYECEFNGKHFYTVEEAASGQFWDVPTLAHAERITR